MKETVEQIKDGLPHLTSNLVMSGVLVDEMQAHNDMRNVAMLASVRRLMINAQEQVDTLLRLRNELNTAINRPSWSFAFRHDVRKPKAILADIDVILGVLTKQ